MTQRESILSYIVAQLQANGGLGAEVYRSRQEAFNREEGSAISVQPEEEPVDTRTRNMDTSVRFLTLVVTVFTRGSSTSDLSADQVADPILLVMHATVMKDITLGGRATAIFEKSTRWTFEEADQTALATEVRYAVTYQTRSGDLSALV